MSAKDKESGIQKVASILMDFMKNNLEGMQGVTFSKDPELIEKDIIEYNSRMRTFGLEKFNGPCYIAAVNLYLSQRHLEGHDALGAIIFYLNDEIAFKLLKAGGFLASKDDDEDTILDGCGELAKAIAGKFKNELASLGYKDLTISDPIKQMNDISGGVDFNYNEYKMYELSYHIWKEKALVVSITLAPA